MNTQIPVRRMSPLTALFLGIAAVCITGIVSVTAVGLYGLRIVDSKASAIVRLAEGTVHDLPALVQQLGPAVTELLGQRDPSYSSHITVKASFLPDSRHGGMRVALNITNNGDETVSYLGLRVAALDAGGQSLADWSDVVATPLAMDDLPGPLLPGKTRHIILRRWNELKDASSLSADVELTEVRLWRPAPVVQKSADVAVAQTGQ